MITSLFENFWKFQDSLVSSTVTGKFHTAAFAQGDAERPNVHATMIVPFLESFLTRLQFPDSLCSHNTTLYLWPHPILHFKIYYEDVVPSFVYNFFSLTLLITKLALTTSWLLLRFMLRFLDMYQRRRYLCTEMDDTLRFTILSLPSSPLVK